MPKIFISYRRTDSKHITWLLHERLVAEFNHSYIYFDLQENLPGTNWQKKIDDTISTSTVMLVIIGADWSGSRLHDTNDYVRYEIEQGLKLRLNIIPVLLGNTPFPKDTDLPSSIRKLASISAIRIHDDDKYSYDSSLERLFKAIKTPNQKERYAKLVVKRASQFFHGDRICELFVDDEAHGTIANGEDLVVLLDPGIHKVKAVFTFEAITTTWVGVEHNYYYWPQKKETHEVAIKVQYEETVVMHCGIHDILAFADRGFILGVIISSLQINDVYLSVSK